MNKEIQKWVALVYLLSFSQCVSLQEAQRVLVRALNEGEVEKAQELIRAHGVTGGTILNDTNKTTALMRAAQKGLKEVVELLLQKSSDQEIRQEDSFGYTALWFAFQAGHKDVARMILQKQPFNESELVLLAQTKSSDFVSFIMSNQEGITAQIKHEVLKKAVAHESEDIAQVLLADQEVASLSKKEDEHSLQQAIAGGDRDLFNQMLEKKIDLSLVDDSENTLLMQALESGNNDFLQKLIKAGINVDVQDKSGKTALMKALDQGNLEAVRILLRNGADSSMQDTSEKSALARAIEKGYNDIARDMIQKEKKLQTQELEEHEDGVLAQELRAKLERIKNKAHEGIETLAGFKRETQKAMLLYPWAKKEYISVEQNLDQLQRDFTFLITTADSQQAVKEVNSFDVRLRDIKQKMDRVFYTIKNLKENQREIALQKQTQQQGARLGAQENEQKEQEAERQKRVQQAPQIIVLVKRIKEKIHSLLEKADSLISQVQKGREKYADIKQELEAQHKILEGQKAHIIMIYRKNRIKAAQQSYDIGALHSIYQEVQQSENTIKKSEIVVEKLIEKADPGFFARLRSYFFG